MSCIAATSTDHETSPALYRQASNWHSTDGSSCTMTLCPGSKGCGDWIVAALLSCAVCGTNEEPRSTGASFRVLEHVVEPNPESTALRNSHS